MAHDNAGLVRRWFEEVWNQRREEVIEELLAPEGLGHGLNAGGLPLRGPEGFRQIYAHFLTAFPDLRIEVEDVVAQEDRTVARIRCRGTHGADLMGIAATQRPVEFTGLIMARWHEGRIAEAWNEVDFMGLLQQLNAETAPELRP